MHDDQIDPSGQTARELITAQFPDWAHRPVRRVEGGGTVNAIFRVGADLAARSRCARGIRPR
jgi:aminoglycoside phosphotransferase (APT) family kinase protein